MLVDIIINILFTNFSTFISSILTPGGPQSSAPTSASHPFTALDPPLSKVNRASESAPIYLSSSKYFPWLYKLALCTGHPEKFPGLGGGNSLAFLCPYFLCDLLLECPSPLVLLTIISPSPLGFLNPPLLSPSFVHGICIYIYLDSDGEVTIYT